MLANWYHQMAMEIGQTDRFGQSRRTRDGIKSGTDNIGYMIVERDVVDGSTRIISVIYAPLWLVVKLPSSTVFHMLSGLGSHSLGTRTYAVPDDSWAKRPEKEYAKLM